MTNPALLVYLPYAAIAVTLTIWLARTISRHGEVYVGLPAAVARVMR